MKFLGKVAWIILKAIFGIASLFGAMMVGWSSVALYLLVSGKVTVYFEQPPPVAGLVTVLAVGAILLIGGYKAPAWLDVDRLL